MIDRIDATLALPYSGNSTTGLDGGLDIDPDYDEDEPTCACGAPDGLPCICDVVDEATNDPDPELNPDYLAFLSEMPTAVWCEHCGDPIFTDLSAVPQNTVLDMPPVPSATSNPLEGSRQAPSWEFQSPNLRTRLDHAISKARSATSRIDRREWEEEAQSLLERLVDADAVCSCGVAYNVQTGQCDECVARQEQLTADRARFGVMALDIDPALGF